MLTQEDEGVFRPPSASAGESSPGKRQQIPPPTILGPQLSPPTPHQNLITPKQPSIPRNVSLASPGGLGANRPVATPSRHRSNAPTSIPNFPSAGEHRTPAPASGLPPSPIRSPAGPSSPIQSPPTPATTSSPTPFKMPSTLSLSSLRSGPPSSSASSPWQFLGATSGAPTPSLDGPGRSSPHIGGPFEQLNLNGSWSGGNLWAEGSGAASSSSTDLPPLATPSRSGSAGSGAGMNAEMLAKYRNMAGRASASGSRGENSSTPMEGVESQPPTIKPSLPAALARRRGSLPKANLTLPNTAIHGVKSPSPLGGASTSTETSTGLHPLAATDITKFTSQTSTLVLDVRPPSAYLSAHLPSSHSIPIPSTLLRRPAFTIVKVLQMLSAESRHAVQDYKTMANIVLLDVDSTSATTGSLLEGLAAKFIREGFGGRLWFVKGGQAALEAIPGLDMISTEPIEESDGMTSPGPSTLSPSGNFNAGGLGSFAFLHGSTGGGAPGARNPTGGFPFTPTATKSNPFDSFPSPAGRPLSLKGMMLGGAGTANNSVSGTSGSSGSYKPKLQPANPFFDNIRQNLELSHGGITERIPLQLSADTRRRAHELPAWLSELVTLSEAEGADQLAQQFYKVERNEQKRLQALMDWHTEGSGAVLPGTTQDDLGKQGRATSWARQQKKDRADVARLEEWGKGHRGGTGAGGFGEPAEGEEYYPFSITAGVERGIKNRYKNIWPYDFSRVRLVTPCEDESDYINASYIQPRGTSKRYIATQGPLDATFRDFWTLVWEQDVRVIVMLTKQFEGGQVKCGNYWQDCNYGALHLRLERQTGGEDLGRPAQSAGFDFGPPASPNPSKSSPDLDAEPKNIRRVFYLSNDHHPSEPPRKIVQIQCVSWPDFDVPTSPDVLLGLITDVADARDEVDTPETRKAGDEAPVLIHCSAGIGRTGSFILVDSILDALARGRNEQRKRDEDSIKPHSIPIPASASARSSVVHSRHASGSPKAGAWSESGDSGLTKGHGSRVKSVSFASGDKIVLPGSGLSDGETGRRIGKAGGTSPIPPSGLGISTPIVPATKSASAPIKLSAQPAPQTFDWLPQDAQTSASTNVIEGSGGEAMEVDSPFEYPPSAGPGSSGEQNQSINQWLQYREDELSDAGTNPTERRPSLASAYTSDEKLSDEKLSPVTEDPQPIAVRNAPEQRAPTPLSQMENPVLDVLESMRVQRMSLVQSLRQYVFAYKVIIHQSFAMLNEENARDRRNHSGMAGEEDDSNQKRRASPTELAHDRPSIEIEDEVRRPAVDGALGRKASVKRMKQEVGMAGMGSGSGLSK